MVWSDWWSEYGCGGSGPSMECGYGYGGVWGVVGVVVQDSGELWRTFGGEKYGPGVELRSTISPPPRIVIK